MDPQHEMFKFGPHGVLSENSPELLRSEIISETETAITFGFEFAEPIDSPSLFAESTPVKNFVYRIIISKGWLLPRRTEEIVSVTESDAAKQNYTWTFSLVSADTPTVTVPAQ